VIPSDFVYLTPDLQSLEAYRAEQERVERERDALPDVETMLGLDEMQVGLCPPDTLLPWLMLAVPSGDSRVLSQPARSRLLPLVQPRRHLDIG
jgi:hypothetical protein